MDSSSTDWSPPSNAPAWEPFARAVRTVIWAWDLVERAVDEHWGSGRSPRDSVETLVEDALANFADRWKEQKRVDADEISNFLVMTLDDLFNADVEFGVVFPVGRVLSVLYGEAFRGELKGVNHVLETYPAPRGGDWLRGTGG